MANALLDALGYVGETLDKPGRAVRGLLGGRPEEAAAIIPFSDSLGLTDQANRVSGSDLLRRLGADPGDGIGGTLAGIGVEMATDPLMFAGAGIGGLLGKRAGAAAMARGPRYETSADDLARMVGSTPDELAVLRPRPRGAVDDAYNAGDFELGFQSSGRQPSSFNPPMGGVATENLPAYHASNILASPAARSILGEIPPGSTLLGTGAEGLALRTPTGDVLRIGEVSAREGGRLISQNIAQATRSIDFPQVPPGGFGLADDLPFNMRAERVPMATDVGNMNALSRRSPETMRSPMNDLSERLRAEGIDFWDNHVGNAGLLNGRPVVIDPGAVTPSFLNTSPLARQPVISGAAEASPLMSALIRFGGGDEAVRAAIEAGRLDPGMMQSLARIGGMGGAGLGAAGRTLEGF